MSPQKENGYTQISNELFEAIIRFRLPARHKDLWLFVLRKTYGYHKKNDYISLSQYVDGTGIDRKSVCEIIKDLVEWKLLIKNESNYGIQKDYTIWLVGSTTHAKRIEKSKEVVGSAPLEVVGSRGSEVVGSAPHTKETITKERKENVFSKEKTLLPTTELKPKTTMKKNTMGSYSEDGHNDYEEVVDIDTGESPKSAPKKKIVGKNQVALRLLADFRRRCKESLGVEPTHGWKEYKMALFAISNGLTEPQVILLFDDWFSKGNRDEETIQITRALSTVQLNNFKLHER